MKLSLDRAGLVSYAGRQIENVFPDGTAVDVVALTEAVAAALERVEHCFANIDKKYFQLDGRPAFNHRHGDQYAMFLYLVSRCEFLARGDSPLAEKLFALNKALHGIDVFYAVDLPPTFLFSHPVGTIVGNARYGDYFAVYQNCTVGSTGPDEYPTLGDGVVLYANATVLGRCDIGDDVTLGAGSFLVSTDVPARSLVVGHYPDHAIRTGHGGSRARAFGPAAGPVPAPAVGSRQPHTAVQREEVE